MTSSGRDASSQLLSRIVANMSCQQRFGKTDRRDPAETARIWAELWPLVESGRIRPSLYDQEYAGLETVSRALNDIASRKVWGKAVIRVDECIPETSKTQKAQL
jgi:NADPH:quinone reductase-like Zn-dependent oxidoreductase